MSVSNLESLFRCSDAFDRREGMQAYFRYHYVLRSFAEHYGVAVDRTIAAFAALSPNNDYKGNLRSLASVLEAIRDGAPLDAVTVSTYRHCAERAWAFATGAKVFTIETKGLKTLAFYDNILKPWDNRKVTIDGHMVAAWRGERLTMKEAKVEGKAHYLEIQNGVIDLARRHGVLPSQMQATLWFARKRIERIKFDPQTDIFSLDDVWQTELTPQTAPPFPRTHAEALA